MVVYYFKPATTVTLVLCHVSRRQMSIVYLKAQTLIVTYILTLIQLRYLLVIYSLVKVSKKEPCSKDRAVVQTTSSQ